MQIPPEIILNIVSYLKSDFTPSVIIRCTPLIPGMPDLFTDKLTFTYCQIYDDSSVTSAKNLRRVSRDFSYAYTPQFIHINVGGDFMRSSFSSLIMYNTHIGWNYLKFLHAHYIYKSLCGSYLCINGQDMVDMFEVYMSKWFLQNPLKILDNVLTKFEFEKYGKLANEHGRNRQFLYTDKNGVCRRYSRIVTKDGSYPYNYIRYDIYWGNNVLLHLVKNDIPDINSDLYPSIMKRLTGADIVFARNLYQNLDHCDVYNGLGTKVTVLESALSYTRKFYNITYGTLPPVGGLKYAKKKKQIPFVENHKDIYSKYVKKALEIENNKKQNKRTKNSKICNHEKNVRYKQPKFKTYKR